MKNLQKVKRGISFPQEEEEVLKYWEKIKAFETSVKKSEGKPAYSFYDGPPFATGMPHYGHILAGTIKDIVTRYFHQNGFYVERRFGWDCHGLPIEFAIEKELGLTSKEDIMKLGIKKYNAHCKSIVMKYAKEWERIVGRLGRWIDFRNDYKTMNLSFMESVWWVFSELYKKGLVYRGFKVMPYSTACTTSLSNFEVQQNYKETNDPSVIVTFPLKDDPDTCFLAWTTTPWTLPSNLALCVKEDMDYIKFSDKQTGKKYIAATCRMSYIYRKKKKQKDLEYTVLEKLKGKDLIGTKYVPLFPYYINHFKDAFRVVADDYVTVDSGTGIVHQAPAFGEDDFRICMKWKIIEKGGEIACPLDDNGRFLLPVKEFKGLYVKDADKEIIRHLKKEGRCIREESIVHNYPFCWRSDTPLIYRAIPSWFVRVEKIKEQLLESNKNTYWVPSFVKEKRFHNWLENARDWAISRSRYFGCPMPVWANEDYSEIKVISSVEELEKYAGRKITDIHREFIDDIEIPSKDGKGVLKRIPEVFDCWFESGSMPYAQNHFPFENKEKFLKSFPADFIAEGLDQTRGWFYTLTVLGTALFGKSPFKNVIVNGLVLAEDGKKMSKRLKNYPDPEIVINKHGADALRLYLINSPVVRAENLKFCEKDVKEVVKTILLPWFNAYRFFIQNSILYQKKHKELFDSDEVDKMEFDNVMDKWILSCSQSLVREVRKEMEKYRLYTVVAKTLEFVEFLTNWYVRFNRDRLKGEKGEKEWKSSLSVLFKVLFISINTMSPFTPFLTELMYKNLKEFIPKEKREDSVHFLPFPKFEEKVVCLEIEEKMNIMREIIVSARKLRDRKRIGMKFPVKKIIVVGVKKDLSDLVPYIKKELNCKELEFEEDLTKYYKLSAQTNNRRLGKRFKKELRKYVAEVRKLNHDEIAMFSEKKEIVILGEKLTEEDLLVKCDFIGDEKVVISEKCSGTTFVLLDFFLDEELILEGYARTLVSNIQQLRKKLKMEVDDKVKVYFKFFGESLEKKAYTNKLEVIQQHLKSKDFYVVSKKEEIKEKIIGEETYSDKEKKQTYSMFFTKE